MYYGKCVYRIITNNNNERQFEFKSRVLSGKTLDFQLWYQQPLRICLLITACNKNDTVSQWYLKQQGIDKAILNGNGAEIHSQCEVWFNLLMRENKEHFSFLAYELAYNCLTSKQGQMN